MKNIKEVKIEIPEQMKHLKSERGFPVPFIVLIDNQGKAHFKINDDEKYKKCVYEQLCPICGLELYEDMWFIGGPQSAFNPVGVFIDSPVHKVCGTYSLRVCPYLATKNYNSLDDEKTEKYLSKIKTPKALFVDQTMIPDKPKIFIFARVPEFGTKASPHSASGFYLVPRRPYLEIEIWNHGEELNPSDSIESMKEYKSYLMNDEKFLIISKSFTKSPAHEVSQT
ncbi:MAG: hypothetical protein KG003_08100 [Bacteroidetes bacterium]|nr:hypothetical protein [Bacteroidota bacterium]